MLKKLSKKEKRALKAQKEGVFNKEFSTACETKKALKKEKAKDFR